jgi:hypothetical protein
MKTRADVTVWLAAGVLLALFGPLLTESLWVVGLLPIIAWGVAGLILLAVHSFRIPTLSENYSRRWNTLGVVAGYLLFVPLSSLGGELLHHARFRANRSEYERVVIAVESGQQVHTSLQYLVDGGPPKRVAFVWPGGVIDNWCGIVHDRTGHVLEINHQAMGSPQWRSHSATRLFGGDMFSCHPFEGSYYLCCFT